MLEGLLLRKNYGQVVYIGDGRGDFCPCTRLGPGDLILSRSSYPDATPCSLTRLLAAEGAIIDKQVLLDTRDLVIVKFITLSIRCFVTSFDTTISR